MCCRKNHTPCANWRAALAWGAPGAWSAMIPSPAGMVPDSAVQLNPIRTMRYTFVNRNSSSSYAATLNRHTIYKDPIIRLRREHWACLYSLRIRRQDEIPQHEVGLLEVLRWNSSLIIHAPRNHVSTYPQPPSASPTPLEHRQFGRS